MEESEPNSPSSPSLKQRLKSTLCLPSPFRKHHHHHHHDEVHRHQNLSSPTSLNPSEKSKLIRTSSVWIKSRGCHDIPEIKDKFLNFISRIGRHGQGHGHGHGNGSGHGHHHRRRHSISSDFQYDALSYSLNFDDGGDESHLDEFNPKSFSSRLPPSPTREIECT